MKSYTAPLSVIGKVCQAVEKTYCQGHFTTLGDLADQLADAGDDDLTQCVGGGGPTEATGPTTDSRLPGGLEVRLREKIDGCHTIAGTLARCWHGA